MFTETGFALVCCVAVTVAAVLTLTGCAADQQNTSESAVVPTGPARSVVAQPPTSATPSLLPDIDVAAVEVDSDVAVTEVAATADPDGAVVGTVPPEADDSVVLSSPTPPPTSTTTMPPAITTTVASPTTTPTTVATTTTTVAPPTVVPTSTTSQPDPPKTRKRSSRTQAPDGVSWFKPMYTVDEPPNPNVTVVSVTHHPATCVNNNAVFSWTLHLSDGTVVTRSWSPPVWVLPNVDVDGIPPETHEIFYWDRDPVYGVHPLQVAFSYRRDSSICVTDRRLLKSGQPDPNNKSYAIPANGYRNNPLLVLLTGVLWAAAVDDVIPREDLMLHSELMGLLWSLSMSEQRGLYEMLLQYSDQPYRTTSPLDSESPRGRRLVEWLLETRPQ